MRTTFWHNWELVWPLERWDGVTWYGGHYGSGREPSSVVYDPSFNSRMHAGFDFGAPLDTTLYAIASGRVADVGFNSGAGNYITTQHTAPWGITYWYRALHMVQPSHLQVGEPIEAGQTIGLVGSTGASEAPHLHAELTVVKPWVDFRENKHVDIEFVFFGEAGRKGYDMVTAWQIVLADLGYYNGTIDGIMGPKTQVALDEYSKDSVAVKNHRHKNRMAARQTGWVSKVAG